MCILEMCGLHCGNELSINWACNADPVRSAHVKKYSPITLECNEQHGWNVTWLQAGHFSQLRSSVSVQLIIFTVLSSEILFIQSKILGEFFFFFLNMVNMWYILFTNKCYTSVHSNVLTYLILYKHIVFHTVSHTAIQNIGESNWTEIMKPVS